MPPRTLQKQLAQNTSQGLLAGITIWIGLLMYGTTQLKGMPMNTDYTIGIGPLVLNVLQKQETAQGFNATITFKAGLVWYLAGCAATGLLAGIAIFYTKRRKD